MKGLLNIHLF